MNIFVGTTCTDTNSPYSVVARAGIAPYPSTRPRAAAAKATTMLATSFRESKSSFSKLRRSSVAQRTCYAFVSFGARNAVGKMPVVSRDGGTKRIRGRLGSKLLTVLPVKHHITYNEHPRVQCQVETTKFHKGLVHYEHSAGKGETSSQGKNRNCVALKKEVVRQRSKDTSCRVSRVRFRKGCGR